MAEQTDQKHTDQLTLEQEEQIRLEIVNSQPIISNVLQVNDLLQEYSNAELPGFVLGKRTIYNM